MGKGDLEVKLLFIQGGSRVRKSNLGNMYVDGNFNNNIWKRYNTYCNDLTVILRKIDKIFEEDTLANKFNKIDTTLMKLQLVEDVYSPKKNFLDIKLKNKIKKIIEEEVLKADKIIIRSIGNFYTNTALKYCKKYNKDYLIEVTGFAFEGMWYHSIIGKIIAVPREIKLRKSVKNAPFAVYVTNRSLQERYPCLGETLGCSDVELEEFSADIIQRRLEKISNYDNKQELVIGTAAFLDVNWKGQQDVIKALYLLKKKGLLRYKYQMVGAGTGKKLKKLINKYDIAEYVNIIGVKQHKDVFKWLDDIDIYIQPSYQEGLCRSIVEAMSRACPIICTNVGGNDELIDNEFIYNKGNIRQLALFLMNINSEKMKKQAIKNFDKAGEYNKNKLDEERDVFYHKFVKDEDKN